MNDTKTAAPRAVPLARLAGQEGAAARAAVTDRVLNADRPAARATVSAFCSSI